jgi:hypothetical protein
MQALKQQLPGWQQQGWLLLGLGIVVSVSSLHCCTVCWVLLCCWRLLCSCLLICAGVGLHLLGVLIQEGCVQFHLKLIWLAGELSFSSLYSCSLNRVISVTGVVIMTEPLRLCS